MFQKGKKGKTSRIDTLIGQHTHIKGDISFSGGLRIDGSVAGNVNATGDTNSLLTLSEQGRIEGETRVPNLIVNGHIVGNIYASEHLELAPKARIEGNVHYHLLKMIIGAEVNGQMIHIKKGDDDIINIEHEVIDDLDAIQIEQKANS